MIRTRMKEYRARTGMKQEELAALVGVRRETIGNLENGKYNPSLVLAWRMRLCWRRRRDLNPCTGSPAYEISSHASSTT